MTHNPLSLRFVIPLLILVALVAMPLVFPFTKVMLTLALAKGLAVLGIVVLLHAGQVSFGHALFFAVSAYSATYLGKAFAGGELFSMMLVGLAASLMVGLFVGLFVVRYRYIFFGMLNLAFSMILFSILEKFYAYTGGSDGMQVARPLVLGFEMNRDGFEWLLFYLALVIAIACGFAVRRYLDSPIGHMLRTVATNETRLEYLGVSAQGVLLAGYVVSAGLCGLGGVLMAVAQGIVTPEYAWWVRSGELVFIAILGGAQSVAGAFVGAIIYETVRTYAAAFAADAWQMILGFFLLGIILYASRGLVGLYSDLMDRIDGGRTPPDTPQKADGRNAVEPAE
jgi:ABC-type branched-subunit amino acid transport system permease subunit